jgi:hypothetical protein
MISSTQGSFAQGAAKLTITRPFAAFGMVLITCVGEAAAAGHQVSRPRASALHECSILASRYTVHDWGNIEIYQYRACMSGRGQPE